MTWAGCLLLVTGPCMCSHCTVSIPSSQFRTTALHTRCTGMITLTHMWLTADCLYQFSLCGVGILRKCKQETYGNVNINTYLCTPCIYCSSLHVACASCAGAHWRLDPGCGGRAADRLKLSSVWLQRRAGPRLYCAVQYSCTVQLYCTRGDTAHRTQDTTSALHTPDRWEIFQINR